VLKTPSKKFEFYAQTLKQVHPSSVSRDFKELPFFPHRPESKNVADEKQYPFHLHVFKTMALEGTRNANQPWLQAIAGSHVFERWETWVEINPETAKRLGISNQDWIWVESPKGRIRVKARVYKGAMPDVVSIPFGSGHRSGGRWAMGLGENPYRLLNDDVDDLTGYPATGSTRVRMYKA
jgi:molybdopterin-containing oxidoreductase family iron-sulfur binding subunit